MTDFISDILDEKRISRESKKSERSNRSSRDSILSFVKPIPEPQVILPETKEEEIIPPIKRKRKTKIVYDDDKTTNEESAKDYKIQQFDIQNLPDSCSNTVIGSVGSGKTSLSLNFSYFNCHKFPVAHIKTGSFGSYKTFINFFPEIFVHDYYSEESHSNKVIRQKKCLSENYPGYIGNNLLTIYDDLSSEKTNKGTKILNSPEITKQYKVGTRHYNEVFFFNTQTVSDLPTYLRENSSYVYLFKCVEKKQRQILFDNFGGICRNEKIFGEFLDEYTGNFGCLVIQKMSPSSELVDNVFFYRTIPTDEFIDENGKPWKFGCSEIWKHDEKRRDKSKSDIF